MKAGRVIGISVFCIGLISLAAYYFFFWEANTIPRLFIAAPALIMVGLVMIVFPGGDIKASELDHSSRLQMWGPAPLHHKVAWVLSLIAGGVLSFLMLLYWF